MKYKSLKWYTEFVIEIEERCVTFMKVMRAELSDTWRCMYATFSVSIWWGTCNQHDDIITSFREKLLICLLMEVFMNESFAWGPRLKESVSRWAGSDMMILPAGCWSPADQWFAASYLLGGDNDVMEPLNFLLVCCSVMENVRNSVCGMFVPF